MDAAERNQRLLHEHQAIFDGAAIGIVFSRGHRIERCNRRAAELFGYEAEQLVGLEASILYADMDHYVRFRQAARAELFAGRPFVGDVEMRRRDGSPAHFHVSGNLVDPEATVPEVVWTFEDITAQRATRLALETAQRELDVIFESAVIGITLVRQRRIVRCNRRLEDLFRCAPGEMMGLSTRAWYLSDEEYRDVGAAAYEKLLEGNYHRRQQLFRRFDGSTFWGEISGCALDPAQPQDGSVWLIEDISERQRMLQRLELAQRVFETSSEAIVVTDAANRIVSVNAAFERITGYSAADVLGRDPGTFKSGRHDQAFYHAMWQSLRERGRWQGEVWDRRKDGSIYPKLVSIDVISDPASGEVANYVAVFSDFTERKANEDRVAHLAHHDALTGLSNRRALGLHLEHQLAVARRNGTRVAVLFVDLDGFKPVNDGYGHAAGDSLLVMLAERLRRQARESDLVARLGGDEFVLVIEGRFADDDLAGIAANVAEAISQPCELANGTVQVSCSIGIACTPQTGDTTDELLRCADAAMYRAKAAGKACHAFFQPSCGSGVAEEES